MSGHRKRSAKPPVSDERKFKGLRRFNLVMGFLHLVQGAFMILVSNDTTYPIFTNYLNFDINTFSLKPNAQLLYNLPFGIAVSFFLLISAVAHFYLATIGYGRYVANLKKGMNPVRFYEYALSSSLMIVLIGMLTGIWDLGAIILIFTLNATMNLFGIMMELHNQHTGKTNWTAFIYGCIAGIVPWIVITLYFVGAVNSGDAKPPAFVYTIVPTLFVFFNIFAINMVLQYKKIGPWKGLPVRRARLHHPEPGRQEPVVLADLDRHPGPRLNPSTHPPPWLQGGGSSSPLAPAVS